MPPTITPAKISLGQWTPQNILAMPFKAKHAINIVPKNTLKNNKEKDIAKKKDACPEGKEGYLGTGINILVFSKKVGLFLL